MACNGTDLLLSVKDWHYRAEGNASFVIFNPTTRTILKLRKRCAPKESIFEVMADDLQPFQGFIETVIEPLLGTEYICLSAMIPVNQAFLERVAQYFEPQRPEKRLHKQVDISKKYALSLPDFCFLRYPHKMQSQGPTFCIELKPKRGFLPVSGHIPDDLAIKYSVCRYCLLQQYKVQQGIWEKRSHYCPLDLFSCDPSRMKYSLNMLLENPQNNLRIFKDGVAIYHVQEKSTPTEAEQGELVEHLRQYFEDDCVGEKKIPESPLQSSCVQSFLDVIIQALMSSSTKNGIKQRAHANRSMQGLQTCAESGYSSCYKDKYPTGVSMKPSDNCILRRLVAGQSLTVLEIDVILPLYQKVLQYIKLHPEHSEKYRLDFPYDEDFSSMDEETWRFLGNLKNGRTNGTLDVSGISIKDAVQLIREYLITRTLQDCSIMLAVQLVTQEKSSPLPCSVSLVQSPQGRRYLYSASVVDLDPKPSTKIPTYESLDRKIARGYVRRHQNGIVEPSVVTPGC
ncbi:inositol-pentakisphosphate 2-kinase-like [Patiria miniata]|uniref:Inositol-pentakisphosphate 2-kinase n=1 Tax=Patiria miniata TaxID=46514 RepID=A0A913ZRK0_PATMI|nr:inositol-pentakisphosphate 2-kinase-like [Patiria miniata]XP_038054393.1 inositol-pentakisphosphate 2-kinase-like [Patiria miniata]XP_038054394.1 inositol-pentakisphosphate 2-kinase-like [Patiria miniata]